MKRLREEDIHCSIWLASDRYQLRMGLGQDTSPEAMNASLQHTRVWWKTYRTGFLTWTFALIAIWLICLGLARVLGAWPIAFAGAVTAMVIVMGYRNNSRTMTVEEWEALLPGLNLGPVETEYSQAMITLHKSPIADEQHQEIIQQMNMLMDEHERLLEFRNNFQAWQGEVNAQSVQAEIDELQRKLTETSDENARGFYQQSIALAETRSARIGNIQPEMDRLDAQESLIRQTLKSLRDSFSLLKMGPKVETPDTLQFLRESTNSVQNHIDSIEKAVLEMKVT